MRIILLNIILLPIYLVALHLLVSPATSPRIYADSFIANVSCYNAEEAQTDSTPREMANGKEVFVGAVANNYYPFGTRVLIKGKEYIVSDRMARKNSSKYKWDIYFEDKAECLKFGRQYLIIKIKL